jgi:hypothetical protein
VIVKYTVYDHQTGVIAKIVDYPEEHALLALDGEHQAMIEGEFAAADFLIIGGFVVPKEPVAPIITPEQVKAQAWGRIMARYPDWKQLNLMREGGLALDTMSAFIDAVRAASNALEALNSIPIDFADDTHWPA